MLPDFNRVISRLDTASLKWDSLGEGRDSGVLSMWVADMDFPAPEPVLEVLKQRVEHGILGYTLREYYYDALVEWLHRRHNWGIDKGWIVNCPGVVPAMGMMIDAFSKPGDGVIVQQPVYYPFANLVTRHHRQLLVNQLHFDGQRYTMDFDDLEQKLTSGAKLLLLCSPHNPVGRVWTKEELSTLGELCNFYNVLIISDEIHCDLILPGYTHTPLASISEQLANRTLTCMSPSKTFNLAGLQTAAAIIPNPDYRQIYQRHLAKYALGAGNTFGILAADAAYRHGEAWLNELIGYLDGNVRYLSEYIQANIPQLSVIQPEGTYLVWIDCRRLGLDSQTLHRLFREEAKIALDDGELFGEGGEGFVRINVACPIALLTMALQRVEAVINACSIRVVGGA